MVILHKYAPSPVCRNPTQIKAVCTERKKKNCGRSDQSGSIQFLSPLKWLFQAPQHWTKAQEKVCFALRIALFEKHKCKSHKRHDIKNLKTKINLSLPVRKYIYLKLRHSFLSASSDLLAGKGIFRIQKTHSQREITCVL